VDDRDSPGSRFDVIPALDLARGRLARLTRGDPDSLTLRSDDPLALAERYATAGARIIHVVDLDAALTGVAGNLDVLERICDLPVLVEAGGGLTADGVEEALARGADRAVLGAASLADPAALEAAIERYGPRIGVAVDVQGGRIRPRGGDDAGPSLDEALAKLARIRPAFLVYTDVDRDGSMAGPDLTGLVHAIERTDLPVVASGGVRSIGDLRALAELMPPLAGAIVGRALHEGRLRLEDGLALSR
jgi:phosphoribosylformimino-5-aminoimidazole carboxamide ribotide isomerase